MAMSPSSFHREQNRRRSLILYDEARIVRKSLFIAEDIEISEYARIGVDAAPHRLYILEQMI
jgi:hypothetical protein